MSVPKPPPSSRSFWVDNRKHTTLGSKPTISSVSQIKGIIGRNLQCLDTLELPEDIKPSVDGLNSQLANSNRTLDEGSLNDIYNNLVKLEKQLILSKNDIDQQISRKRNQLPLLDSDRKKKLESAKYAKAPDLEYLKELSIRETTVPSVISNIRKCLAGIKPGVKPNKDTSIDSLTALNIPETTSQPPTQLNEPLVVARDDESLTAKKVDIVPPEKLQTQEVKGVNIDSSVHTTLVQPPKQSKEELFSQFQREQQLMADVKDVEQAAQQETVSKKVEEARKRKSLRTSLPKAPLLDKDEDDAETSRKFAKIATKRELPDKLSTRTASLPPAEVKSLPDEDSDAPQIRSQKLEPNSDARKEEQGDSRSLGNARKRLAKINEEIKRRSSGQKEDVVERREENELETTPPVVSQIPASTITRELPRSAEIKDRGLERKEPEEPDSFDRVKKEKMEDTLEVIKAQETQPIVPPVPLMIPQATTLQVDINQRKLVNLHDRPSMEYLDPGDGLSDGLAKNPSGSTEATMLPQLEVSPAKKPQAQPAVISPPAVAPPATDKSVPPPVSRSGGERPLSSLSSMASLSHLSSLGEHLASVGESFVANTERQSVLHCPSTSVGLAFQRDNLCKEFATEYSINEKKQINVIDSSNIQSKATDDQLTKKLSFSEDGKVVTLPNDNIVKDTVYALNTIARSNMLDNDSDTPNASIKIKNVQEQGLLKILQKFNEDIIGKDDSIGLKGHLQLSYENPVGNSPNEKAIQDIIKQHNDLHSTLQSDADPEPGKVQEKLSALTKSITELNNKLTTPQPSHLKADLASTSANSKHHRLG